MKRTEKSRTNCRQKQEVNQQQARVEHSQRQERRTEGLLPRRGEVRGEHSTEESCSQPVTDVQQGQYEPAGAIGVLAHKRLFCDLFAETQAGDIQD